MNPTEGLVKCHLPRGRPSGSHLGGSFFYSESNVRFGSFADITAARRLGPVGGVGRGFLFAALLFSTYLDVENRAKGDVGLLTVVRYQWQGTMSAVGH